MTVTRSVADVLTEHVRFQVECIDRMFLNVYVPKLQYPAGLVGYVHRRLGLPIASTAPLAKITDAFSLAVHRFAYDKQTHGHPWTVKQNLRYSPSQILSPRGLRRGGGRSMLAPTRWRFRRPVAAVVAVVVLVLAVAVVMADRWNEEKSISIQGNVASAIATEDLTAVARTGVFFGHFSVGMNVLEAVPGVYADHGVSAPPIEQGRAEPGPNGGFIAHQFIGEDVKPLLKLEDFDRTMRGGMGRQVDVALMKFCWVDISSTTDVDALFVRYRDTMAALERDFPNVTFIHVTVPLTTEPGLFTELKTRLKTLLGRSDLRGQGANVARERLNALIRGEYAGRHLFDLAAIESTKPDGTRVSGRYDNQGYFALYDGYASDMGHLNAVGSKIAATAFLEAIAQASRK